MPQTRYFSSSVSMSSCSTASITKHARWLSGSQSLGDGGSRKPWRRFGVRRLLAAIHDPDAIARVLAAMGLPLAAPELAAARSPPVQADLPW